MTDRDASKKASAARSSPSCGDERMSRIGKQPIEVPSGVEVDVADGNVGHDQGSPRDPDLDDACRHEDPRERRRDHVERPDNEGFHRSLHGLTRSLLPTWWTASRKGFEKRLQIVGVGYRAGDEGQ
jgi:large subunit ribosomal protein L6